MKRLAARDFEDMLQVRISENIVRHTVIDFIIIIV
jgi:hypothetical protein